MRNFFKTKQPQCNWRRDRLADVSRLPLPLPADVRLSGNVYLIH